MGNKDQLIHDFGYGIIPKTIMKDKNVSIQAKAIYAYLCSYAGNKGTAFPSVGLITYELNIHKDTFYKYLKELKETGYIEVYKDRNRDGQFSKNIYKLIPCPKTPDMVSPDTASPDTVNPETISNSPNSNSINSNNVVNANKFYQDNFGMISPYIADCIQGMVDELGEEMTIQAMKVALKNNVRKIRYVEAILYDWSKNNIRTIDDLKAHELERQHPGTQTNRAKDVEETQKMLAEMWGDDE